MGLVWEYEYSDWLMGPSLRRSRPSVFECLRDELAVAADLSVVSTIFIRGELGIGKSTIRGILTEPEFGALANPIDLQCARSQALRSAVVMQPDDSEPAVAFASRLDAIPITVPLIVLGRPGTLEAVAQWTRRCATLVITLANFDPTGAAFGACLDEICQRAGLIGVQAIALCHEIAARLPNNMRTPYYFQCVAEAIRGASNGRALLRASPLEICRNALESRELPRSSGVLGNDTGVSRHAVRHEGDAAVGLALRLLNRELNLAKFLKLPTSIPALHLFLAHVKWQAANDESGFLDSATMLKSFVCSEHSADAIPDLLFVEGLIGAALDDSGLGDVRRTVRERCQWMISGARLDKFGTHVGATLAWDVSDSLSMLGDERLLASAQANYSASSGYFVEFSRAQLFSGHEAGPSGPRKAPMAGKREWSRVWVGKFLVTNELFLEFVCHPMYHESFDGVSGLWQRGDARVLGEVRAAYDRLVLRVQSKEHAGPGTDVRGLCFRLPNAVDRGRRGALGRWDARPWDVSHVDDRFNQAGCPVVGVNWWEAIAFCQWWREIKLPSAEFPRDSWVSLLTRGDWEAVSKLEGMGRPSLREDRSGYVSAMERGSSTSSGEDVARRVARPLHVGLYESHSQELPCDMFGNASEWTRSRALDEVVEPEGRAVSGSVGHAGEVISDEVLDDQEVGELRELVYNRSICGGSFLLPWTEHGGMRHAEYPPFISFCDVGFRLAVYSSRHS